MSKTSNYNLQLDQQSDYYDIDKHNDNYNIIDAAMKNLEDTKAVKGTAYVKGENNVKVIQGVPVGGQFENLGVLAGYLKIKFPVKDHTTPIEFDVSIRHVGTENLTAKYRIKAHLPSGNITASYQDVTVIKGTVNDLVVDFCKGATEDYLIFRLATGTKDFGYSSIVIDNIHYRGSTSDFSTGWGISIVTALETLDNTKKSTVTPTLNATTLQGLTWDTAGTITGEANKLFRFSDVANTVKHIFKIMKSSVNAFRVAKDDDTEVFNVDTTNSLLTGLAADKKQDKLKLENNLKVVHGIPIGGQKYFGTENQTGAIKIKLPTARTNTRYSFKVRLRNYTTNANKIFLVSGINYDGGVGSLPAISNYCKVVELSGDTNYASKTVKFYTGLEEDYIVIGGTTDTWDYLSATVSEVEYFGTGLSVDWSTGWSISMLTVLEDLTSTYYVTVIPNLNSTSLNGLDWLIGEIKMIPYSTLPTGYLKTNGAAISRTTYANLFALIGTTFGAGDGSTTFNLPDLRGVFIRGWDDERGIDSGRTLGSYQDDELKAHYHQMWEGMRYILTNIGGEGANPSGNGVPFEVKTGLTGGAETRPKNIALMAIIKY